MSECQEFKYSIQVRVRTNQIRKFLWHHFVIDFARALKGGHWICRGKASYHLFAFSFVLAAV